MCSSVSIMKIFDFVIEFIKNAEMKKVKKNPLRNKKIFDNITTMQFWVPNKNVLIIANYDFGGM